MVGNDLRSLPAVFADGPPMSELVVVGSLNCDLTVRVDRLPGPGETILATSPTHTGFGGKGGNQACAAVYLGGDVEMVARVGDDEAGARALSDLRDRGVGTALVRVTENVHTGTAFIFVDGTGDNMIVVDPGANAALSPADVTHPSVASAAIVLIQLEVPTSAVAAAVQAATGLVVLNPAPAAALDDEILSRVSVLVPNQTELARLTGYPPPGDLATTVDLARKLPFEFDVVVTMGPQGALVCQRRQGRASFVAAPQVNTVDATGAGDVFCGALVMGLSEHGDLERATSLAVAAASLSTTARGARGLLPTRQQAEALLAHAGSPPVPT